MYLLPYLRIASFAASGWLVFGEPIIPLLLQDLRSETLAFDWGNDSEWPPCLCHIFSSFGLFTAAICPSSARVHPVRPICGAMGLQTPSGLVTRLRADACGEQVSVVLARVRQLLLRVGGRRMTRGGLESVGSQSTRGQQTHYTSRTGKVASQANRALGQGLKPASHTIFGSSEQSRSS